MVFAFVMQDYWCMQMAVTTYDTSLPAAERYKNGYYLSTLLWDVKLKFELAWPVFFFFFFSLLLKFEVLSQVKYRLPWFGIREVRTPLLQKS